MVNVQFGASTKDMWVIEDVYPEAEAERIVNSQKGKIFGVVSGLMKAFFWKIVLFFFSRRRTSILQPAPALRQEKFQTYLYPLIGGRFAEAKTYDINMQAMLANKLYPANGPNHHRCASVVTRGLTVIIEPITKAIQTQAKQNNLPEKPVLIAI